jgi:hypothetical protein
MIYFNDFGGDVTGMMVNRLGNHPHDKHRGLRHVISHHLSQIVTKQGGP